jgi:hypothetical protein
LCPHFSVSVYFVAFEGTTVKRPTRKIHQSPPTTETCENGYLIYVKPMILGNESTDVQSYHAEQREFPQQSTADQWFNESQTESYLMLGLETMDEITRGLKGSTLQDSVSAVEEYIKG